MNRFLTPFIACFLLCSMQSAAQEPTVRCATVQHYQKFFGQQPAFKRKFEQAQTALGLKSLERSQMRLLAIADTITLVVHVIGSTSMQQQITDAIIQSQVDVLNEDYQGKNADSSRIPAAFKPRYGKSKITFKLAGSNPYGEPTTGIIRTTSNNTYTEDNFDEAKSSSKGGSDTWEPTKYLNIWLVSFASTGVLGISILPGDPRPLNLHGFVCDYRAFGRGATYLFKKYSKGRTTTHELGHFFNLYHTWGDDGGSCTGSDFPNTPALDDTPNQADNTNGNPDPSGLGLVKTDACSPAAPGVMYQNYMDYSDDSAMVMFTNGQQDRMQIVLTSSPDRAPLLQSNAYLAATVFTNDAWIRKIVTPSSVVCSSKFAPVVTLRNSGSSALTSVKINYILNNQLQTFNWTGNLAAYSEVNVTLPSLTAAVGGNTFTAYTTLPNSAVDPRTANDTSKINFEVFGSTSIQTRFEESFSATTFPPNKWRINNPDNDMTWQRNPTIGKQAPGSAWFNDFNNINANRYDDLITPNFSYESSDSVYLYFNLAAATYSNPATTTIDIDTLTILVTKDCGNSFTTVYKKWGNALQTLGIPNTSITTEFFPTAAQWRRDTVALRPALSTTEDGFQIYFRISGNAENNIFIDDISLLAKGAPSILTTQGYQVYPTVTKGEVYLRHLAPPLTMNAIQVFNAAGQLVWQQQYNNNSDTFITVNLQGQPAGVYFVRLNYADGRKPITQRIVKQ